MREWLYGIYKVVFRGFMNSKEIVLKQIEEYNNQDIEKCLSYCDDEIEVLLLPNNESLFKGKDILRSHLKSSFGTEEFESVEVLEVIFLGDYVTTVEKKTKKSTGETRSLLITYFVKDALIKTMWAARS
ncbi:MAG: hypothetical protein COW00_13525 [Bdellovibrio sp. CG12_big_fil_rev_8_21_14_0_65_39_13]|nr:MAG: hypothetical protein COW78_04270 [Bdellovibrio sp. CG22_combo_CG10-13_8_21_14_all_39_27]PIQ58854.1 MAG: hypothetical protein COW00_13525 [Bdellovibrio sp. CG12_big_fil_rev_8_21_14_0_65_39_13]PIR34595.1 MAG: hypothetical protein COV37_12535 [Bdellovibrio sp. CG11_big_fil_rev_8_21_14_0_20_39_38]